MFPDAHKLVRSSRERWGFPSISEFQGANPADRGMMASPVLYLWKVK